MSSDSIQLRLGTRGSLLARRQSQMIADELMRMHPGLRVEMIVIKTSGDRIQDKPLADMGGKGLFTKEIEQALLDGRIDFAVHSYKDVPVTMPLVDQSELVIAAVPQRENPFDAMASLKARSLDELPRGAKVGTGSLRRRAQLLDRRPDLVIENIRGNVDTRLGKMKSGEFDAVVLAVAGLKRCGLFDPAMMFELKEILPAAAQGALAIQCRKDNATTRELVGRLNDRSSQLAVDCERAIVMALNGDCHSPIAALATMTKGDSGGPGRFHLRAIVGARDGNPPLLRADSAVFADQSKESVAKVTAQLTAQGVYKLLHGKE